MSRSAALLLCLLGCNVWKAVTKTLGAPEAAQGRCGEGGGGTGPLCAAAPGGCVLRAADSGGRDGGGGGGRALRALPAVGRGCPCPQPRPRRDGSPAAGAARPPGRELC